MVIVVDNYDSFVHNLARYLRQLGQTTLVLRNEQITPQIVRSHEAQALVFSPGPGTPQLAGNCLELIREFTGELPILGVCLGHQAIAAAWGGNIVRAPLPLHGRASSIQHTGRGLFTGLPNPLRVGRYHSLVVEPDSLPFEFQPTAWTEGGLLMALEHRELPVFGVQFHPESVLTQCGYELLATFLRRAHLPVPPTVPHQPVDAATGPAPDYWQEEA